MAEFTIPAWIRVMSSLNSKDKMNTSELSLMSNTTNVHIHNIVDDCLKRNWVTEEKIKTEKVGRPGTSITLTEEGKRIAKICNSLEEDFKKINDKN